MKKTEFYESPSVEIIGMAVEGQVFSLSGLSDIEDMGMEEW